MLLQTKPGELFICRNASNIVPAYGDHNGGVSATIEYAVNALKVQDIVVCGHSDCEKIMDNLRTHPSVAAAIVKRGLQLHGWLYQIEDGEIFSWSAAHSFVPLDKVSILELESATAARAASVETPIH